MNKLQLVAVGSLAVLLAACGGGNSETLPPTPPLAEEVPDTASASVDAMADFLVDMTAATSETKDPLSLARYSPKLSEVADPRVLK
jgi:hypothetical protein